tara:strand:- start:903 stop:1115 length:213 start_codon:yes stop_codon:yes gene_type:complete
MQTLRYMSTFETAEHIRVSTSWLAKSRLTGDGPPFIKAGRTVLYDIHDVDRWMAERKRASTSASAVPNEA